MNMPCEWCRCARPCRWSLCYGKREGWGRGGGYPSVANDSDRERDCAIHQAMHIPLPFGCVSAPLGRRTCSRRHPSNARAHYGREVGVSLARRMQTISAKKGRKKPWRAYSPSMYGNSQPPPFSRCGAIGGFFATPIAFGHLAGIKETNLSCVHCRCKNSHRYNTCREPKRRAESICFSYSYRT